jgi:hypothetical protein
VALRRLEAKHAHCVTSKNSYVEFAAIISFKEVFEE